MSPEKTDSGEEKQANGFGDPFRWIWDLFWGILLSLVRIVLFGNRPRGCRPVPIDTPDGSYHGCGRAWRYGRPSRFASVCRHCIVRTDRSADLVLCSMGQDPRFSLHAAVSVPAILILVALIMGLGVLGLFSCGLVGEGQRKPRLRSTVERLLLGDKPAPVRRSAPTITADHHETAASSAMLDPAEPRTALGTKLAPDARLQPVPSAMERFQKIQEGPGEVPGPMVRPVPRPLFPEPLVPEEEADGQKTDAPVTTPGAN